MEPRLVTEGIAAATAPAERTGTPATFASHPAPVGVALVSLCLGAVALGRRCLTTDEATSVMQARKSLGALLSRIVHDDPGQAGQLLLLKLAATVGPTNVRAVALPVYAGALVLCAPDTHAPSRSPLYRAQLGFEPPSSAARAPCAFTERSRRTTPALAVESLTVPSAPFERHPVPVRQYGDQFVAMR